MHDKRQTQLTATDLERRIRAAVPNALVLDEHLVRRAVREHRGIRGVRTFVPHTHVLALPARTLGRVAEESELGGPLPSDPEAWVVIVPRLDDDELEDADPERVLLATWRRLFHGRMDEALGRLATTGALDRARALELVDYIGQLPMDEARALLADEGLRSPHDGVIEEVAELVALFAELRFFAPELLPRYFPSLQGRDDLPRVFDDLCDARPVFEATRPDGAPDPRAPRPEPVDEDKDEDGVLPRWRLRQLLESARRGAAHGRSIDAAVWAWRARRIAARGSDDAAQAERIEEDALAAIGKRLAALGRAGEGPATDASEWAAALEPLLPRARWGMTGLEARLLHDLQKACDDGDRPVWDLDLGRWLRSFGRAPLRREEVFAQKVALVRHLASASRRLVVARIGEAERRRLSRLLGEVTHRIEEQLRSEVGDVLGRGLAASGLVPTNLPERVAERKIVAELCDKLLDKGFIAFPDLRDLVARNQLKLPDLTGPREWAVGDALLVFDRFCHAHLDAAYRRGEIYRRSLQRLSSLLFATAVGRFIVRFLLLPFGGSFFLLEGLDHTVMPLIGLFVGGEHPHLMSLPAFIAVGVILFGVLHAPAVRRAFERGFTALGRALGFVFKDLPAAFRALPPVAALLRTRAWRFFREHVWRPALFALGPTALAVVIAGKTQLWLWVGLPLALVLSVYFATRPGRHFVEISRDWWVRAWHELRTELLPGLFAIVMSFFKAVIDRTEVVLYVVDSWLRYRRSDAKGSVALKAVLGFFWSMLAYLVRLVVNLVAEPQLNPIKHFPVVTVSHKFFIPMTLTMHPIIGAIAQLALPGLCGFLVWEFKESWRLYQSNRYPNLRPVIVGSHGEPIQRLLRPGFHSGTVPTLFKKLRRAERKGLPMEVRRLTGELHHVEEAIERFVARELESLLALSGQFPEASALDVEHVQLTPARIGIRIGCAPLSPAPLELAFEEQAGHLVGTIVEPGFARALDAGRRTAFEAALLGLYKLAGVDLVREHIATLFPGRPPYDIGTRGLVVWPGDFATEVVYPLRLKQTFIQPVIEGRRPETAPPAIRVSDLAFKQRLVPWRAWTEAWQGEAATREALVKVLEGKTLLALATERGARPQTLTRLAVIASPTS